MPSRVFAPVNRRFAWRLLLPMLPITGISGVGALPNLWKNIAPAIEAWVGGAAAHNLQPYFATSFVFSALGVIFFTMILSRQVDIQLVYFAGRTSFALSFLWFVCAVMSLLPHSLMDLHRVFIVIVVVATVLSQFVGDGTIRYYWRNGHYGDFGTEVVFIATYLAFAWPPLHFALTGGNLP